VAHRVAHLIVNGADPRRIHSASQEAVSGICTKPFSITAVWACRRMILSVVGDLGRRRHIRALHGKPGCLEKRCPSYGDQGFESIFLERVGQGNLAFRAGVLGCVLVLCGANFRLNASTR
jgi:hypothetical protein